MAAISRDFSRLTQFMIRLKQTNPFVLVLGADAAPVSRAKLEQETLKMDGMLDEDIANLDTAQRTHSFKQAWSKFSDDERYTCLDHAFHKQIEMSGYQKNKDGYLCLAQLIKYEYFNIILTTNIDSALEDALIEIGLKRREWQVLINGVDTPERISRELVYAPPRIKILKLHGDLYARKFAFDYREVFQFSQAIESIIKKYLSGSVLMVGKDSIDEDINRCFPPEGGNFYYVNINAPQTGSPIHMATEVRNSTVIQGEEAEFSSFFSTLSKTLLNLQKLSEVGIELGKISDKTIEAAAQSEEPLVEILGEANLDELEKIVEARSSGDIIQPIDSLVEVIESPKFYIKFDNDRRLSFTLEGQHLNYESERGQSLDIDTEDLNDILIEMGRDLATYHRAGEQGKEGRDSWRKQSQREGKRLFKDILASNPNLMEKLGFARQAAGSEENLQLCFVGSRNHLGMPYELLYETDPWAVRYPICRQVTGVTTKTQSFGKFFSDLLRKQENLRVLLIASGTAGINPDSEIKTLAEKIQQKADSVRLKVQIERVPTETASLDKVDQLLKRCSYHIVHYAGHSYFDAATGEGSGLSFWQHPKNRSGNQRLTARALSQLLRDSQTMLFYLSSCVGAAVGGEHLLRGNDYLGVMDAIVQAGIPNVLGYRWYVTDSGARQFAINFYESLLETHSPNRAALYARQEIYRRNATDETWMSPILVVQNL